MSVCKEVGDHSVRNGQVKIKIIITISVVISAVSRMMKIADNSGQLDVGRVCVGSRANKA